MNQPSMQTALAPSEALPHMPINQSWIKRGNPIARGTILMQTLDGKVSAGLWSCEPGEFQYVFAWDEFIRLIEGEVTITEEGGRVQILRAGDMAHFPRGLNTHWTVTKTIRKFFVIRTPEPLGV